MNCRILFLIAIVAHFFNGNAVAQSEKKGDAKQKAHEAMVAAEKEFNLIDGNIKALQARRPVPNKNGVIVPVVPEEMLKRREVAWNAYQKAAAEYKKFDDSAPKVLNAYEDAEQVRKAVQRYMLDPNKFTTWLEEQKVDINHPVVRTNLMKVIKGNTSEDFDAMRFLIAYGTKAGSYRDELLEYAKSGELKKKDTGRRIYLVSAIVKVDPSAKDKIAEITKDWVFAGSSRSNQTRLRKALDGEDKP